MRINTNHLAITMSTLTAIWFTAQVQAVELTVIVDNIEQSKGRLQVAMNDAAGYGEEGKKKPIAFKATDAAAPETSVTLSDVPNGRYAIRIRHDVNSNNKLDKNFLGIPKEPWGVSNDTGSLGLPDFEEAAFDVTEDMTIRISLR